MSPRFSLSPEDIKKWARTAIIIYAPVLLMALDQIQSGTFDMHLLYAGAISITIDLIRRFIKDYTK